MDIKIKGNTKALVEKFFAKQDRDKLKIEITPYRDWKILVKVFFVVLVVLVATHVYVFVQLSNDTLFAQKDVTDTVITFNKDRLLQTVDYYDAKEATYREILETKPSVVDPAVMR